MRRLPQSSFFIDGVQVVVRSELRDLLSELADLYPEAGEPRAVRRNVVVEVTETRTSLRRRRYTVSSNGRQVGEGLRHDEVFPFVEWAVNLGVIEHDAEHVLLHAASLSRHGAGFILAGGSGSGKSTLAAGLMARGWNYLCDEFALIAPDTLSLHPFRKAICTKSGSFPVMRQLGLGFARRKDYIKRRKGRVGYIRPLEPDRPAVEIVAPVRYVIFPEYIEGAPPRLEPMPRAHALMELAGCVFNRHAFADQALPILARALHEARCYRLTTGQLEDTCALLEEELIESQRPVEVAEQVAPLRERPLTLEGWPLSRRKLLKRGVKLAYAAPIVVALSSEKAFAAGSNPSAMCSTGLPLGELCVSDSDCCSGNCNIGICE